MSLILRDLDKKASDSVAHYWQTLEQQGQMDGFAAMVRDVLVDNGLDDRFVVTKGRPSLPGYFRATKRWDMLVVRGGLLVAALEFKSQRGPSFGDDLDAITLEALGTGHDFWAAYGGQSFGPRAPRPWLGWLMLVEDCPTRPAHSPWTRRSLLCDGSLSARRTWSGINFCCTSSTARSFTTASRS